MLNLISLISMMHDKFDFSAPKKPQILEKDFLQMRLNFLLEELTELSEACGFSVIGDEITGEAHISSSFSPAVNSEQILDAIIDLQVVLLGTAHLMGFFNQSPAITAPGVIDDQVYQNPNPNYTIFEEAFNRVWIANMRKEACQSADESKRGFKLDLKKPAGWKAPQFSDLIKGFLNK